MRPVLSSLLAELRRSWAPLLGAAVLVAAGNWGTAVVLASFRSVYGGGGPFDAGLGVRPADFAALGIIPILAASLLAEARLLGWERSSLKKLFERRTQSVRTDIFYLLLQCANLHTLAGLTLSLGLGYWLQLAAQEACGWGLLRGAPLLLQFAAQWLAGSFVFYAVHWAHHTRFLWEIHKVHHAAETMTMATNFRAHPLTYLMRAVCEAFTGAALGIHPAVVLAYLALSGTAVVWQHCEVDWGLPWLERWVLIGAAGHRLHHSKAEAYYNTNLGYFVLWDWLFGTLRSDPGALALPIGVDDPAHNSRSAPREMLDILGLGVRAFFRELLSTGARAPR